MMKFKFSNEVLGAIPAVTGIIMFSAKAVMVKLGYRFETDTVTLLLLRMIFALPFYLIILYTETKKQNSYEKYG